MSEETRRAFEELVQRHSRVMAAAIRRVCGRRHRELVPDAQQELYLALWRRLQSGKRIAHPTSYLYKAAMTAALGVVRRLGPELGELDEQTPDRGSRPAAEGLLPAEQGRLIEQVLSTLDSERQRAVRGYLAGLNHREVARLYGWSESVARHRIYRTLEEIRRRLREGG